MVLSKKFYKYMVKCELFKFDLNTSIPKFTANNSLIAYTNQDNNSLSLIRIILNKIIELNYGKDTYSDEEFSKLQKLPNEATEYLKKRRCVERLHNSKFFT